MNETLSPALLLNAYAQGIFPMADDDGEILWFSPDPRTIFDLDAFHVPRNVRRLYAQAKFPITVDQAFAEVIDACANRPEGSWINDEIRTAYLTLHEIGFAHSVEVWADKQLAGGLYGVALAGAFFGESMFHRVTNASKLALVALVERLRQQGFTMLDIQFTTPHLTQFHCIEIPREEYLDRLNAALEVNCRFID